MESPTGESPGPESRRRIFTMHHAIMEKGPLGPLVAFPDRGTEPGGQCKPRSGSLHSGLPHCRTATVLNLNKEKPQHLLLLQHCCCCYCYYPTTLLRERWD